MFTVAGGYLIVDDTVVDKPYAHLLGEAAWVAMLVWTDGQVRPAIPSDWTVRVLADRDLWARWLCRRIIHLG